MITTRPQAETYSDDWFQARVDDSKAQGYSADEITNFLIGEFSEDELFKKQKKWDSPSGILVKNRYKKVY